MMAGPNAGPSLEGEAFSGFFTLVPKAPSASALAVAVSQQFTIVCFLYGFGASLGTVARKAMPDMSGRDASNILLW